MKREKKNNQKGDTSEGNSEKEYSCCLEWSKVIRQREAGTVTCSTFLDRGCLSL